MALIPFPDIPPVEGVSDIPINAGGFIPSSINVNTGNIISAVKSGSILNALNTFLGEKYGIYKGGKFILDVDTVREVTFSGQSQICNYPVEQGAFYSYNKVQVPNTYTIEMLKTPSLVGSSLSDVVKTLEALLRPPKFGILSGTGAVPDSGYKNTVNSVKEVAGVPAVSTNDIEYVDVITPYRTYTNVQLISYSVNENSSDGKILNIQVTLSEVMQAIGENENNPSTPNGASLSDLGKTAAKNISAATDYVASKVKNAVNSIRGVF